MTLEEALLVAQIAGTADGGCYTCVGNLVERLNKAFPQYVFEETNEYVYEQPDWSEDPDDACVIGIEVLVREAVVG